jgi:hypothetical protein
VSATCVGQATIWLSYPGEICAIGSNFSPLGYVSLYDTGTNSWYGPWEADGCGNVGCKAYSTDCRCTRWANTRFNGAACFTTCANGYVGAFDDKTQVWANNDQPQFIAPNCPP